MWRYSLLLTFLAFQLTTAGDAKATETDYTSKVDIAVTRNLEYAKVDDQSLKLDLFVPDRSNRKPPLVIWIHGGGWRGGSRKSPRLQAITQHGFAVASISYRFTDKAVFPAQIHDCKAAVRWLRANADQYGYRTDRIAVAGSSAGGHLALLLGVSAEVKPLEGKLGDHFQQPSRVHAIIDYFGPSDFVLRGKTQPGRAYTDKSGSLKLLGGAVDNRPTEEHEQFASPAHYVTQDDPPLLAFHGDKDTTVLLDQSERIVEAYRQHKLEAQLVVLKDAGHGGKRFFSKEQLQTAIAFLKKHLQP